MSDVYEIDLEKNPKILNTVPTGGADHLDSVICLNAEGENVINSDYYWSGSVRGLEVIERDVMEIVEARNGSLQNFFPNTEFIMRRNAPIADGVKNQQRTDTMLIFVGESWCYGGGKIRDMITGYPSGESIESFRRALTTTVGSRLSALMNCDLHQSCWPGDQTTNMFLKAESMLKKHVDENHYKKLRVVIQITDSHRDENMCESYPQECHIHELATTPRGLDATEWLAEYDRGFLQWADDMRNQYPHKDIEFVIWKNFNPWMISEAERAQYQCKTPPDSWAQYCAEIDGFPLDPKQQTNNANLLSLDENINFVKCTKHNTSQTWRQEQMVAIDRFYDYINGMGQFRSGLFNGYPTPAGHKVWATQLCKAGDWFYNDFEILR